MRFPVRSRGECGLREADRFIAQYIFMRCSLYEPLLREPEGWISEQDRSNTSSPKGVNMCPINARCHPPLFQLNALPFAVQHESRVPVNALSGVLSRELFGRKDGSFRSQHRRRTAGSTNYRKVLPPMLKRTLFPTNTCRAGGTSTFLLTVREYELASLSQCAEHRGISQSPPLAHAFRALLRIDSPSAKHCRQGTMVHVGLQGSHLNSCYYHQDLH